MDETKNSTEVKQTEAVQAAQPIVAKQKAPVVRKFELAVYDITINEATGKEEFRPIAYTQPVVVEATSPRDLKEKLEMYKQCGQLAKVVREIDPPVARLTAQPQVFEAPEEKTEEADVPQQSVSVHPKAIAPKPDFHREVKYYKVGDIEIKDDNGTLYQKQWMKLTESEASNFRIINDKNNGIVSLAGKHIEMKKWILVENTAEDESTALEENMTK